jgi:hypothetical protein
MVKAAMAAKGNRKAQRREAKKAKRKLEVIESQDVMSGVKSNIGPSRR